MKRIVKQVVSNIINDEALGIVLLLCSVFAIHFASIALLG